jgi:hypothetical protein
LQTPPVVSITNFRFINETQRITSLNGGGLIGVY